MGLAADRRLIGLKFFDIIEMPHGTAHDALGVTAIPIADTREPSLAHEPRLAQRHCVSSVDVDSCVIAFNNQSIMY